MKRFGFVFPISFWVLWGFYSAHGIPLAYAQEMGELLITSSPSGAQVYVDGRLAGTTPYGPDRVTAGIHEVVLRMPGRVDQRRVIQVQTELTTIVDVLLPLPPKVPPPKGLGSLKIETNPSGATVILDGFPIGKTPLFRGEVKPGLYKVRLVLSGYKESVHEVEVERGKPTLVAPDLKPKASLVGPLKWWIGGALVLIIVIYLGIRASRSASTPPIRCPHPECGKLFRPREILYGCEICTEPSSRSGNPLQYKFVLEEPENPVCPKCGQFVFEIFCPRCKESLPAGLRGVSQVHIIALAGATNSGKTCYITSLVETLKRSGYFYRSPIAITLDPRSNELHRRRLMQLRDEGIIKKTEPGTPDPLIIRLNLGKWRETVSLVFYDVAGEAFSERHRIEQDAPYVTNASAIILLVPADHIQQGKQQGRGRARDLQNTSYQSPDEVLEIILQHIDDHQRLNAGEVISTPLAITITKIDKLQDLQGSELFQRPRPRAIVDDEELLRVNQRCLDLLKGRFRFTNLVNLAEQRFGRVWYFGVQSIRETGRRMTLSPVRVEQPLFWILEELALLQPSNWLVRGVRLGEGMFRRAVNLVKR